MDLHKRLAALVTETHRRLLAALVYELRDIKLAEDALHDALLKALECWAAQGLPNNPAGWLFQTAKRRAIDIIRRQQNFTDKQTQLAYETALQSIQDSDADKLSADTEIADERLRLIFTCCLPALAEPARVSFTLNMLGRLTTDEIARAFLVAQATTAQRLVRANRKIRYAGISYQIPPPDVWPERMSSVLSVI